MEPRNPSDTRKAVLSLQYLSCQAQERYWAQRSVRTLLGRKENQRKGHVFSFSHSFFFLQKKEWEKKEKRHPRSLRSVSLRRLRRNLRRLASQRRLPGRGPVDGRFVNRPYGHIYARRRFDSGPSGRRPLQEELASLNCHFEPVLKLVRNLFPEDKIPHRCAHRFGMTRK